MQKSDKSEARNDNRGRASNRLRSVRCGANFWRFVLHSLDLHRLTGTRVILAACLPYDDRGGRGRRPVLSWVVAIMSGCVMNDQQYLTVQATVICLLLFLVGTTALIQHPTWFE